MRSSIGFLVLAFLAAGCSESTPTGYTGILRIDAGTEYAFLERPSNIGGACDGWSVVEVRQPGKGGTGMDRLMCWKRDGSNVLITDRIGTQNPPAPMSAMTD